MLQLYKCAASTVASKRSKVNWNTLFLCHSKSYTIPSRQTTWPQYLNYSSVEFDDSEDTEMTVCSSIPALCVSVTWRSWRQGRGEGLHTNDVILSLCFTSFSSLRSQCSQAININYIIIIFIIIIITVISVRHFSSLTCTIWPQGVSLVQLLQYYQSSIPAFLLKLIKLHTINKKTT